jgi:hypothetical protein
MLGGPDGNGRTSVGHIRWTTWSTNKAVGWAVGWTRGPKRCVFAAKRCAGNDLFVYKASGKHPFPISATHPVKQTFTHLIIAHDCLLYVGTRGPIEGYAPASCHTWRLQSGAFGEHPLLPAGREGEKPTESANLRGGADQA